MPRTVKQACNDEASEMFPLETGGTYMGWWSYACTAVITTEIGPGPNASHGRHHFQPDQEWQLEQIARHYVASGRRETYLGDWHSLEDSEGRERLLAIAVVEVRGFRQRNLVEAHVGARRAMGDENQRLRMGVGQWGVDDSPEETSRNQGGADSGSEKGNDDRGEAGVVSQGAKRSANGGDNARRDHQGEYGSFFS